MSTHTAQGHRVLRSAVIGVGYLGKFHAEKYAQITNSRLVGVCDTNRAQADCVAHNLQTKAFYDYRELTEQVDAVSIVTPTPSHFTIAKFFLEHGVHVLLEKPMTQTEEQAKELIAIAEQNNCTLQVGHIERYNNTVQALGPLLHNPRYIESTRHSAFKTRGTDVNVVFDMMIHDIDIIQHLVQSEITNISAKGISVLSPLIDISNARIEFANGTIANVTASRVSLKSERSLRLFQANAYLSLDLHNRIIAQFHKVKSKPEDTASEIIREEQQLPPNDALLDQIQDFIENILAGLPPRVSAEDGLRALLTATQITQIMRKTQDWNYHERLQPRMRAQPTGE